MVDGQKSTALAFKGKWSAMLLQQDTHRDESHVDGLEDLSFYCDENGNAVENSAYGTCDPLCSVDEVSSVEFEDNKKSKTDLFKAITIFASVAAGAAAINHSWVAENQGLAMILVFTLGYAGIIFEESLAFNKSGVGLLMAVTLWVIRSIGAPSPEAAVEELTTKSAEVSEIVFFLLGAMTIVEIIDAHQGFKLVIDNITTRKPKILHWVVHLIEGVIDQVESRVYVSWVQPRVLGILQIKSLGNRLDNRINKVHTTLLAVEGETPDLMAS